MNSQLSEEVQRAEQQILENYRLQDSLRQQITKEGCLQEELQRSLEYFRAEDMKQQYTISSIQRQLENLRSGERAKGLRDTIRHKTVEIEKLTEQARKNERKLEEKDERIKRLTATINKEKEATAARWKGEVLGHGISLDSIEITGSVFQLLKDIDSAQKANEAATATRAFLAIVNTRMIFTPDETNEDETNEIQDLIANLTRLVDKADGAEGFKQLIDDVFSLYDALGGTANS